MNKETILPLEQFRLPIWEEWDKVGKPCPHHPDGWMAFHNELDGKPVNHNQEPDIFNWADYWKD